MKTRTILGIAVLLLLVAAAYYGGAAGCSGGLQPGGQIVSEETPAAGAPPPSGDTMAPSAPGEGTPPGATPAVTFRLSVTKTGGGLITSDRPGINCGTVCSSRFEAGTVVILTPTTTPPDRFENWSGACTSDPCSITMDSDKAVIGRFGISTIPPPDVPLRVFKAGSGSGIVKSIPLGIDCGMMCNAIFAPGTPVELTAIADTGSVVDGWSVAGCARTSPTCTFTISAATDVGVVFMSTVPPVSAEKILYVKPLSGPGGGSGNVTVTPAPTSPPDCSLPPTCVYKYPVMTTLVLDAIPDASSTFTGWGSVGACAGLGDPCTLTLDAEKVVYPTFNMTGPHDLVMNVIGGSMGKVVMATTTTSDECHATCTKSYPHGTNVKLTAVPADPARFRLEYWELEGVSSTANPTNISLVSNFTVKAVFAALPIHELAVALDTEPQGKVNITAMGVSEDKDRDFTKRYTEGTAIKLKANPEPGYVFVRWKIDGVDSTVNPVEITLNAPMNVIAKFAVPLAPITPVIEPPVRIPATPIPGFGS